MDGFQWRGKPCPITNHALANPVISDLTKHRWRGPILTSDEERDLVRRSQAGGGSAKRRLLEAFDRLLKKIASQYYGPPFEERLGQAQIGFLKAIHAFDLKSNFRVATSVRTYVRNEIWTFVRSHYRRWRLHEREASFVSLESLQWEAPERNDRDGERWETWEPRRPGYRRPYGRVNWWWRPPAWARRTGSCVVITPMRALEPVQRLLKQIGRLYRFECWFPRLGDCKPWSKHVVGIEFKDIPFPILPGPTCLVNSKPVHRCLPANPSGKTTPLPPVQPRVSGQVRISIPGSGSATRHAELQRNMTAYNEKHMSTWSGAELSKKYRKTRSLNLYDALVDNVNNGEQWKNSIEQKETLYVRKSGLVEPDAERDGVHHRLSTDGRAAAHLRPAASAGDSAGG